MPRTPHSWIHMGIDEIQVNGNTIDGTYKILNIVAPGAVGSADSPNRRYVVDMTGAIGGGGGGGVPGGSGTGGTGWGAAIVDLATTGNQALTGLVTLDGVLAQDGDLVLVWQQNTASENGVYVASSGAWSRADAYNTDGEIFPGQLFYVKMGATYADSLFSVRTDAPITIGSSAISIGPLQPIFDGSLDLGGNDIVNVGSITIGGVSGDSSSILDLSQVNNAGILIPSLTTVERDGIASPATGLLVWNETTNQFEYFDGSSWIAITSSSAASSGYAIVRAAAVGNASLTGAAVSDGVTLATGDKFLCWSQTDPAENGIYTVNTTGAWTRTVPYDTGAGIYGGLIIYVNEGATFGDKEFSVTNDTAITVGSTAIAIAPRLNELDRLGFVVAAATDNHGLSGLSAVDGVVIFDGSYVLLPYQTDPTENGVWRAASGAWTRAAGFQFGYQFPPGRQIFVNSGSKHSNKLFVVNTDGLVNLGVDALIIRPLQPSIAADLNFYGFDITNVTQIAVGGSSPHASASLDLQSVNLGLGLPTVTTAERNAISSPREGLVVYNSTTDTIDAYNGSAWFQLGAGTGTFLGLSDVSSGSYANTRAYVPRVNAAETALELGPTRATHFTTAERDAIFLPGVGTLIWNTSTAQLEVYNGSSWVAVDSASGGSATFLGLSDTPADYDDDVNKLVGVNFNETALEFKANSYLHTNSSLIVDNVTSIAIGQSGPLNHATATLGSCLGIGSNAGGAAVDLDNCLYIGTDAGSLNTESNDNIGIGHSTNRGATSSTNTRNVAVGNFSMSSQGADFSHNTSVGYGVMANGLNMTGSQNAAFGEGSCSQLVSGSYNACFGRWSGLDITSGNFNTFIGGLAGRTVSTGSGNIIIGYNADASTSFSDDLLNIGNTLYGNLSTGKLRLGSSGPVISDASLDLATTNGAFRTNRLNNTQRNALSGLEGMLIWNTTSDQLEFHDGSNWQPVGAASTFLSLTDTPGSYVASHYVPRINNANDALEWSVTFGTPLTSGEISGLSAVEGMLVYNDTDNEMEGYTDGAWRQGGIASGLTFSNQNATVEIQETTTSSAVGKDLTVQAQSSTGSGGDGGDVYVRGGMGGSGGDFGDAYIGRQLSVSIDVDDDAIGFFGATPIGRPGVTGSRAGGAALANLLTALANIGIIADNTTA